MIRQGWQVLLFLVSLYLLLLVGCTAPVKPLQRIRVLTYNIRHGQGMDGEIDLRRIADVIERCAPDIVALQEVDHKTLRSGGVNQARTLGALTGLKWVFGRAIYYSGGEYGEAVLTRLSVTRVEPHDLPCSPGHEERCALEVRMKPSEQEEEIVFIATHLDHTRDPKDRKMQVKKILDLVSDDDRQPVILAGDLNAESGEAPMQALLERFEDASARAPEPTFPSHDPDKRIDFILFRPGDRWRVVETRVIEEEMASDHRPLLAVFELLPD